MTQSNFNLPNTDGATFRSNNNTAHQAHATWSSGSTAPSTTYPYQVWVDTANQRLKRRNSANTAWIDEGRLDGTNPLALEAGFREPIATLSDLQAVSTSDAAAFPVRYMRGRASDSDGGEGVFVWDGSDLSTEVGNDEVTASEGDGGIYIAPSSNRTGASGAWVRQVTTPYNVKWWGTDSAGVNAAIDTAVRDGVALYAPAGNYDVLDLTADGNLHLFGDGAFEDASGTIQGTHFRNVSGSPSASLLTVSASSQATKCIVHDIYMTHEGSAAALLVNNIIWSDIWGVEIQMNNTGEKGVEFTGASFFARCRDVRTKRFKRFGFHLNGTGSDYQIISCQSAATNDDAVAGVEIETAGFLIWGGQHDVDRTDDAGIGIRCTNTSGSTNTGGVIEGVLFESDNGISLESDTTDQWRYVEIRAIKPNIKGNYAVRLTDAGDCIVHMPQAQPTGKNIVEFGANCDRCGLIAHDRNGPALPISVDGSSTKCFVKVINTIDYSRLTGLTTNSNLRVIVDDVEGRGSAVHNGMAWSIVEATISDDNVAQITPPGGKGGFRVRATDTDPRNGGDFGYDTGSPRLSAYGAGSKVTTTTGSLSGTTGADGDFTVSVDSASGDIFIENRTGFSETVQVIFDSNT